MKGFRLAVSMVVELADVALPLFKSALHNFSRVASWLLVTLIGKEELIIKKSPCSRLCRRAFARFDIQRNQGEHGSSKPSKIQLDSSSKGPFRDLIST